MKLFPQAIDGRPYTAAKLASLTEERPDMALVVTYRKPPESSNCGELLSAYISAKGIDCAAVGSFVNTMPCEEITGHWWADL